MGFSRIGERKDSTYSRRQFAAIDKSANLAQTLGRDVYQKESSCDPMPGGQRLIWFGYGRDQHAALAQNWKGTCLRIAPHEVEYCVRILYFIFKSLRLVVHYLVCTKYSHVFEIFRSCGHYGTQVSATSKLNSERAHASRCSMDDYSLTGLKACIVEETLPGSNSDHGNRSGSDMAKRDGLAGEHSSRRDCILGIRAQKLAIGYSVNLIANGEIGNSWTQT